MKHFIRSVAALFFLFIVQGIAAQVNPEELNKATDDLYSVFDSGNRPGCAIAVIKDGQKVYQNCFGLADLEHGISISDSTAFFLASVSKQFTGYAIAGMIRKGTLDYNAPVSRYLPEENALWDSVRVKDLIHHTSGIWDWPYLFLAAGHSLDDVLTGSGIFQIIRSQPTLSFPAGSRFQYTSSNYVLLGEIIRRTTDMDYYDRMHTTVLDPAGMTHTFFQKDHGDIIRNRADGYLYKQGKYERTANNLSPVGSGFMYSTIEDMAKWMQYLLGGNSSFLPYLLQTGKLNNGNAVPYAFGLMKRGNDLYWHDGYFQGFRVVTIMNPDADFALVLLSNSGSDNIVRSAFTVARMYLSDTVPHNELDAFKAKFRNEPQPVAKPEKEPVQALDLTAYEGIYLNKDLLICYKICRKGDALFAVNSTEQILLSPNTESHDSFRSAKPLLGRFDFEKDDNGIVTGFCLKQKRNTSLTFIRVGSNQQELQPLPKFREIINW
ncbi:serine hydrolase domain-containing protein [Saccharicrinis sp. FJH54]|uniref:serine hydrolase domain-containing protein n=1 Tax=Saccharicrinis sp. FJH54 TaxID=3344665 RepID=UPI0035D433D3